MTRAILAACALLVTLPAALPIVRAAQAADERLRYDIVVTSPGSKSQGWHGTLYDDKGAPIEATPGEKVMTPIGELIGVAPVMGQIWKPFGMVPVTPGMQNKPMHDAWTYKLILTNVTSKCPSWRGELLRNNVSVKPPLKDGKTATPWGEFVTAKPPHGWVHSTWKLQGEPKC